MCVRREGNASRKTPGTDSDRESTRRPRPRSPRWSREGFSPRRSGCAPHPFQRTVSRRTCPSFLRASRTNSFDRPAHGHWRVVSERHELGLMGGWRRVPGVRSNPTSNAFTDRCRHPASSLGSSTSDTDPLHRLPRLSIGSIRGWTIHRFGRFPAMDTDVSEGPSDTRPWACTPGTSPHVSPCNSFREDHRPPRRSR